ncbi:hypothetical protein [Brevundimonas balnearis]|uniref:Uncharacterized protein n=1 Tax=Brevundimonas balnearis TaxID=1572858 RepID=A0ABV6R0U7_9CAUL
MGESYPAARLTAMASDWLCERYPDALIIREFSVGTWGGALIDLAAVRPAEIIGVEVKGDGDSPTRLKLQSALYSKAAQRMWLLPAPSLAKKCEVVTYDAWGILAVEGDQVVVPSGSYRNEPRLLPTAPAQLLQALWADELKFIAGGLRGGCEQLRQHIADTMPLRDLIPAVCERLRSRPWEKKGLGHKVLWASPQSADHDLFGTAA